ncbi:MAG: Ig-like domain-containing protein [Allosphingosinicella sp.]
MAVNITATRTSTLFDDKDLDGQFDPGDIITTRIRITVGSGDDALGVQVNATTNGLTVDAGDPEAVQVTPIAFDDFMPSITGNTPITFTAGQLLGNDVDPDGAEINLVISGVSSASNGAIVNNGNGTFTFTPSTGYVGTASFQYTVTDEDGLASVSTGVVSFTVTDPVWYVDASYTGVNGASDGSYLKPFTTLANLSTGGSADALDNADDTIFVYNTGAYSTGIVLEAGQKLIGDGHAFSVNGISIGANASNATIGHAGVGVTLATDNTIYGVTLNGTANGAVGIEDGGASVGTLTIDETSITGLGKAIDIDQGGTLAVDLDQLSSASSTTEGVHLQGVTGTFNASTGIIQTSTGTGVLIGASGGGTANSGGDVNFTYGGDISSPGGSVVEIQDRTGGTVTFTGAITEGAIAAGQTGILVDGSAGTINFNGQTFVSAGAGAGNGVTLTNNTGTINFNATGTGLDITTTSGTGLTFTGGGTLNVTGGANSVTTGTGQVLNLVGAVVGPPAMGTSGIAFQTLTSGNVAAGNAINIVNLDAAGAGIFSGGTVTIGGTAGAGADGISIAGSNSTFNFASATIDNTAGDGIEINGLSPNVTGAVTFTTVNIDGVGGAGVNIVGATNAVNINGGTIGATNDPAGDGVVINGGTGAVTVAAAITKTTLGNDVVDIFNHSGGTITFSGALTASGGGGGIRLANNSGGNIDFTGNTTLNTGTLNAINFTNTGATGANVTFSEGTLDLDTTSGTGINATSTTVGAGSLTISGSDNFVNSTTGRAINIDGVTANITLEQVGVTGGGTTTGVFLKNTGAGGQFVVTGNDSTAGSGGTLNAIGGGDVGSAGGAATTGTGIYMENVSNVSLSNMNFTGAFSNFGIRGENVNNFTLRDSALTGTFGTNESQDEGAIRFGTQGTLTGTTGLRGTALFEGNVIGGGYEDNLVVYVYGSNTLNMTVRDSVNDQAVFNVNHVNLGNDSLSLESGGTSNVTLTVNGVTFNGAGGDQLGISQVGNTTQTLNITNNTFHNTHTNTVSGGGGVWLLGGDLAATSNVTVNYTFTGNSIKNAEGDAFRAVYSGNAATINGLILNNTIGTANGVFETNTNGGSVNGGSGINVGFTRGSGSGNINYAVRIEGNTVRDIQDAFGGIILGSNMIGTTGTARLEATILNNTVQEVGTNVLAGLYAIVGGASSPANSQDASKMGLVISGNTFQAGSAGGSAIFLDQLSGNANYYVPGYTVNANSSHGEFRPSGGGGTASTSLDAFFDANNNLISGPFPAIAGSDVDANFTTGITNQNFVLAVPAMAAPQDGIGWEDLEISPVTAPPRDAEPAAGSQTPGDSAGGDMGTGGAAGTGSTGGAGSTGDTGSPATPPAGNVLTQADLDAMVEAAIQRWIDAGATAAQVDAMRAVQFGIVDMAGIFVGSSTHGLVNVDNDAAGRGWFVDSTPGEDGEFEGSGTRLTADSGGAAEGKIDLLTVVMHELGHQIGLGDEYSNGSASDLMYGYVNAGERRLPAQGEAAGATPGSVGATSYAITPVNIGTIPAGKTVDVFIKSTINAQTDGFIVNPDNSATISGSNFANQVAQEILALDSLTLGDLIFLDVNKDGDYDAGTDTGIVGVVVDLYADTNDSGGWDAGDVFLGTTTTLAGGLYSFAGLAPGDYVVVIKSTNFDSGGVLEGKVSVAGGVDPDDNVENDDNGIAGVTGLGSAIAAQTISLDYNSEPTPGTGNDTNNSLDFGFIAPNAAPTSTDLDGDIATYIEGASPVKLDVGGNATLSDSTSADFAGGTLTVAIGTGAAAAEDVLSIGTTGTVTLDVGNAVKVGGTTIGTYAGGTNGDALVVTLNSSANAGNVDDLLQALQYNNTNLVDPSIDSRSVTITLVDGDGTDGGLGTDTLVINSQVDVTGVNDEPAGADNGDTTNDVTTLVFDAADFNTGFTDQDGNDFAGVVITTLPPGAQGTIQLNSVDISAGQFVTLAQLNDGDLTFVPVAGQGGTTPTFTFQVRDDGGVLNSGVDTDQSPNTFTITITVSNVAPTLDLDADDSVGAGTGFASAYTEGGAAAAISDTDVLITDADSGDDVEGATITISNAVAGDVLTVVGALPGSITVDPSSTATNLILTGTGTQAEYAAAIEQVTFASTSDDPTAGGTNASRTINVTVTDGDSPSSTAVATIAVTDVNDAPAGTDSTITATEDSFRLLAEADFGTVDLDGTFAGVTISAVSGGAIYWDADGSAGIGGFVLETLPKTYSAQDLIDGKVAFRADSNLNGTGVATITFAVTDDDGATDASPNTLTVDVSAVNDTPVLTTGGPIAATEQVAVAILPAGSVADVDLDARNGGAGDYAGASFSVNRNPATNTTEDVFTLVAGPNFTIDGSSLKAGGLIFGTISVNGSAGLIVINFTSLETAATSALVDEVIQAVRYTNTSDNPPASVDLAVGFEDGSPGGGQGAGAGDLDVNVVTVNITAVNDAPVNSLGGTIGTGEDAVDAWLSGMSISDPDANPATDQMYVTFQVANGALNIRTDVVGGIVIGDIIAQAVNTITVLATLDKINATLAATNGLTYSPNPDFDDNDTLTVYTNDQGANGVDPGLSGDGTSEEGVATRTIVVSPQPDAPVAQPDAVSTPENVIGTGDLLANNGSGPDTDVDGDAITVSHVNGVALVSGDPIVLASGAILIVNSDGTYSYNPNGKFNTLTDNSSGAVNTSTVGDTFSYTVTGGNTVTVTVTVNGVAGPGDWLMGDGTDNTITGTPQNDEFRLQQGGDDTVFGLAGNDIFYFGTAFDGDDKVDGGDGSDGVTLQGNYTLTFTATNLTGVEAVSLQSGSRTKWGDTANNFYDYNITTHDANVAMGQQLIVNGQSLLVDEDFTFDGSAETDGKFLIFGGRGVDTLTGGDGNDIFAFDGDRWGAGDSVNGGAGRDGVTITAGNGLTHIEFGATSLISVEAVSVTNRYSSDPTATPSYEFVLHNDNVAAGETLIVNGVSLINPSQTFSVDGTAVGTGKSLILIGGAGNDVLSGGAGDDNITGGLRGDTLYGGAGNDIFRYNSVQESNSTERDGIQDFNSGDLIDLSRIDANTLLGGDQAFNFIGSAAFSNAAGELRFENISLGGPIWLVQGDTNGDGVSDFEVVLVISPADPITSSDFIL